MSTEAEREAPPAGEAQPLTPVQDGVLGDLMQHFMQGMEDAVAPDLDH